MLVVARKDVNKIKRRFFDTEPDNSEIFLTVKEKSPIFRTLKNELAVCLY